MSVSFEKALLDRKKEWLVTKVGVASENKEPAWIFDYLFRLKH